MRETVDMLKKDVEVRGLARDTADDFVLTAEAGESQGKRLEALLNLIEDRMVFVGRREKEVEVKELILQTRIRIPRENLQLILANLKLFEGGTF